MSFYFHERITFAKRKYLDDFVKMESLADSRKKIQENCTVIFRRFSRKVSRKLNFANLHQLCCNIQFWQSCEIAKAYSFQLYCNNWSLNLYLAYRRHLITFCFRCDKLSASPHSRKWAQWERFSKLSWPPPPGGKRCL